MGKWWCGVFRYCANTYQWERVRWGAKFNGRGIDHGRWWGGGRRPTKKAPVIEPEPAFIFMATYRRSCCDPIEFLINFLFTFAYRVRNFVFEIDNATLSFFVGGNPQNVLFMDNNINELLPKQFECTFLYHVLLKTKMLKLYAIPLIEFPDFR